MSLNPELLKQIIGKTIAAIVIREGMKTGPQIQLFLIFTDDTYLEFYGEMGWSTHLEIGALETVKQYAHRFGGRVVVIN